MMHNDRLRKVYGSAARLTQAQIDAAPTAWEKRMERRAETARAQLALVGRSQVSAIVKARPVAPAPLVGEVVTVKAAPVDVAPVEHVASSPDALNVRLALVLIDAASDLILNRNSDLILNRKIRALLSSARVVLT